MIGLASRLGMDIVLVHPQGYNLIPDFVELTKKQAAASGGSFSYTDSMDEAFAGAGKDMPQALYMPYIIAAMMLLGKFADGSFERAH